MLYTLGFFSSNCSLFHNANLFGSCIIHILYTGCAKIKKNNSGAKGLMTYRQKLLFVLRDIQNTQLQCNQHTEFWMLKLVVPIVAGKL